MTWGDMGSYAIGIFVAGWISSSVYYQVPHLWQQQHKLQHCIDVAVPTAKKAIAAAQNGDVPAPSAAALRPCPKTPLPK